MEYATARSDHLRDIPVPNSDVPAADLETVAAIEHDLLFPHVDSVSGLQGGLESPRRRSQPTEGNHSAAENGREDTSACSMQVPTAVRELLPPSAVVMKPASTHC